MKKLKTFFIFACLLNLGNTSLCAAMQMPGRDAWKDSNGKLAPDEVLSAIKGVYDANAAFSKALYNGGYQNVAPINDWQTQLGCILRWICCPCTVGVSCVLCKDLSKNSLDSNGKISTPGGKWYLDRVMFTADYNAPSADSQALLSNAVSTRQRQEDNTVDGTGKMLGENLKKMRQSVNAQCKVSEPADFFTEFKSMFDLEAFILNDEYHTSDPFYNFTALQFDLSQLPEKIMQFVNAHSGWGSTSTATSIGVPFAVAS